MMLSDILISQILPYTPTPTLTLTLTRIRHPLRARDLRIPRAFCPGIHPADQRCAHELKIPATIGTQNGDLVGNLFGYRGRQSRQLEIT